MNPRTPPVDNAERSSSEVDTSHIRVQIPDTKLPKQFRRGGKIQKIKMEDLEKPVLPEHISQLSIGNCYMLAVLGSVLDQRPNFINEIMHVNNDGTVEISLHHIKDGVDTTYTYVLDATRIDQEHTNDHKHPAVFLLEKAYALHRVMHQSDELEKMLQQSDSATTPSKSDNKAKTQAMSVMMDANGVSEKKKYDIVEIDYPTALTGGYAKQVFTDLFGNNTSPVKRLLLMSICKGCRKIIKKNLLNHSKILLVT